MTRPTIGGLLRQSAHLFDSLPLLIDGERVD
jgi:hypothetical protein